jgi:ATP-binding cassette subfamily B (MDR/TAP) protein 1
MDSSEYTTPKEQDAADLVLSFNKPTDDVADANDAKDKSHKKGKKEKKAEEPAAEKPIMVPFFSLFRYADTTDKIVMIIGAIAAVINGAVLPAFSILLGVLMDSFSPSNIENPNYQLGASISKIALYFVCIM